MEFWIQQDNNGAIMLPVKPTEFTVNVTHRNTVVNVTQLGDINLIGKTGLRSIPISSFFPAKPYNFSNNVGLKSPLAYVNQLESWRTSGNPVRVIITGSLNMEATIESFSWGERDGTGDIYYTLSLKEYRRIKTKKLTDTSRSVKSLNDNAIYTVARGDCLWNIAKRFYGDGSLYKKIYEANKSKIKNPNLIYTGVVLTIPKGGGRG